LNSLIAKNFQVSIITLSYDNQGARGKDGREEEFVVGSKQRILSLTKNTRQKGLVNEPFDKAD
jgi:hypothetical protein